MKIKFNRGIMRAMTGEINRIVWISGPSSLNEYIKGRVDYILAQFPDRINGNENDANEQLTVLRGAWDKLNHGDRSEVLSILRKHIERFKEEVRVNRKEGNFKIAEGRNNSIVVLQMLEADVTGILPEYYGIPLENEGSNF